MTNTKWFNSHHRFRLAIVRIVQRQSLFVFASDRRIDSIIFMHTDIDCHCYAFSISISSKACGVYLCSLEYSFFMDVSLVSSTNANVRLNNQCRWWLIGSHWWTSFGRWSSTSLSSCFFTMVQSHSCSYEKEQQKHCGIMMRVSTRELPSFSRSIDSFVGYHSQPVLESTIVNQQRTFFCPSIRWWQSIKHRLLLQIIPFSSP
jgi:hypothetical protein